MLGLTCRIACLVLVLYFAMMPAKATVYGLSGFLPLYSAGPNDLIGVRYHFKVITNQSQSLRILFNFNRLHRTGSAISYLIESNIYSGRLVYSDRGCTTWPLLGNYIEAQSSLRNAIADYPYYLKQQPGFATGINTSDGSSYPIQTYLIDNLPNTYKSDAISQFPIDGLETTVTIERGELLSNVDSFVRCDHPLLPGTYRKWYVRTQMEGHNQVTQEIVVLDSSAGYMTVNEALHFASEYINQPGEFTVQIWDQQYLRESDPIWRTAYDFVTNDNYDGNGSDFGVRVVDVSGQSRIELSNRSGNTYIGKGTKFALPAVVTSQFTATPASGNAPLTVKFTG